MKAGLIDSAAETALANNWRERIRIRTPDVDNNILSLSGGNQQKVLFARALGSDAGIILMDDPMRGVDVGTKLEVYELIRAEAEAGRTFIWYTTEIEELNNCDHVYVMRDGQIVADIARADLTEEKVLQASFREGRARMTDAALPSPARERSRSTAIPSCCAARCRRSRWRSVLIAIFILNDRAMSYRGLDLMLKYAVPIAFATIAQMFILTVNDLDLSIGAFVGLVACIARHLDGGPAAALPADPRGAASPPMPPSAR